jgi:triacylglycerol lipase
MGAGSMSVFTEWPERSYGGRDLFAGLGRAPGFDLETAKSMAWAAQLAYETDREKLVGLLHRRFNAGSVETLTGHKGVFLPITTTTGYIARQGDAAIIAFGGTDPLRVADWRTDFSIRRDDHGVHRGFHEGVEAVWEKLSDWLAANAGELRSVHFAGHSLGAALAAVAADHLVDAGVIAADLVRGVWGFGMPRAGNGIFFERYEASLGARTYRLVYGNDVVPEVPPAGIGFRHVGRWLGCGFGQRFTGAPLDHAGDAPGSPELSFDALRQLFAAAPHANPPPWPGDPLIAWAVDRLPAMFRDHLPDSYLRGVDAPAA